MLCSRDIYISSTNDQLFAQRVQMISKMQMKSKEIVRVQTVSKTSAVIDTTAIVSEIEFFEATISLSLRH
jgi:hypothetical protein